MAWTPRKTGITYSAFGTSTTYCYCNDCKVMPGARVSIAYKDKHTAWHLANGVDPAPPPPPPPPPTIAKTPHLPFEQEYLIGKGKLVFAHYMTSLPANLSPSFPGYWTNYIDPYGEKRTNADGSVTYPHLAYGAWARDLPERGITATDWRLESAKMEIRDAIAGGIDGFALNIMAMPPQASWHPEVTRAFCKAAPLVDPNFKIMLELDMNGGWVTSLTKTQIAAFVAELCASPAVYRINGKVCLTAFLAEKVAPSWYTELWNVLRTNHGIEVLFMPTFLNVDAHEDNFLSTVMGWGDWGDRNPAWNDPSPTGNRRKRIDYAHSKGKEYLWHVSFMDQRPRDGIYDESNNTENLRKTWQIARESGAKYVMIPTWNDYAEGSQIAPSKYLGKSLLQLNAFYTQWYKTGVQPTIVRDAAYLSHRLQPHAAKPTGPQTKFMVVRAGSTPPRDTVEAHLMLKAPATVHLWSHTNNQTFQLNAGLHAVTVPLGLGLNQVMIDRNGQRELLVASPHRAAAQLFAQNMGYVMAHGVGA